MKFLIYKDSKKEWRWSLIARNGRIIADGSEGYKRRRNCIHGIEALKSGAGNALLQEVN